MTLPPPGFPPPVVEVRPPSGHRTGRVVAVVAALAIVAGSAAAIVLTRDSGGGEGAAAAGEIFLEPADVVQADPFVVGASGQAVTVPSTMAASTTTAPLASAATSPNPAASATVAATAAPTTAATAVVATAGNTPGLYGGTRKAGRCDPAQQITFLERNPAMAQAFVDALNADPTLRWSGGTTVTRVQLPQYFAELTPVTLMGDTRVTNYGYRNGLPTPHQAVLQAGTAVVVDAYGVPRVKCNCGNPLTRPVAVPKAPRYRGDRWPGFSPTTVIVVQQTTVVIETYVLVDLDGRGTTILRPVGTWGDRDTAGPPLGAPVSEPTTVATVPPATTAAPPETTAAVETTVPAAGDPVAFCQAWKGFQAATLGALAVGKRDDAAVQAALDKILAAFEKMIPVAPADLRADMQLLDAQLKQAVATRTTAASTPEIEAAGSRLTQYAESTCGK